MSEATQLINVRTHTSPLKLCSLPREIIRRIVLEVAEVPTETQMTLPGLYALRNVLRASQWLRNSLKGSIGVLRVSRIESGRIIPRNYFQELYKGIRRIGGAKELVLKGLGPQSFKNFVQRRGEGGLAHALGCRLKVVLVMMSFSEGWDTFFKNCGDVVRSLEKVSLVCIRNLVINEKFGRALAALNVKILELKLITLGLDGLRAIAHGCELHELVLSWCHGITSEHLDLLGEMQSSLRSLKLKGLSMEVVDARGMGFLQKCAKLQNLEIGGMRSFPTAGFQDLCVTIARKLQDLKHLALQLDGSDPDFCAQMLAQCSHLKSLTLLQGSLSCTLTEEAVLNITKGCQELKKLRIHRALVSGVNFAGDMLASHRSLNEITYF